MLPQDTNGSRRPAWMTRREMLKRVGASAALAALRPGCLVAVTADQHTPILYYMDGYHGGVRGHMPEGCWRDILQALEHTPEWKLSLDVEADSWSTLAREDPSCFRTLATMVAAKGPGARVEITGGTFSQPYGWAISGESNIRQLQRGLELIRRSFPQARVETYAVQEPCWASCLPQILRSFGFTGASLKNASTAWGGYTQGFDAELVHWIGPDGSSIPAVPRYTQEHLLHVWETEATEVSPDYAVRCAEHGIPQPAGMCFQDLGWAAQPRVAAPWVRFATWREYIHDIARTEPVDWKFSMEDILTALPWGDKTLHRASQQVREAEVQLIRTEKLCAMAYLWAAAAWPTQLLEHAWDQCMWSQAHDAWITVTTRSGRQAWAFQVAAETLAASDTAAQLRDEAMTSLERTAGPKADPERGVHFIRAVNTLAHARDAIVEITMSADPGTRAFTVLCADGRVLACQANVSRCYRELPQTGALREPVMDTRLAASGASSINAATLLFRDTLPAFGWKTYQVREHQDPGLETMPHSISVRIEADGDVWVESDLYRVCFRAAQGGAIASLYAKQFAREMCRQGKLLNEFRGFFAEEKQWHTSSQTHAQLTVLEHGPLRVKVEALGTLGGCAFRAVTTIVQGQARIDCDVLFHFDQDTWIGDPWEIAPEDRNRERRRSSNDGRFKLQAIFPMALSQEALYKSSAFDVCRSRNDSTHFQRWDEIKHNILTTWVDLYDEQQKVGLALFSDRTTAYSHGGGEPLGIILGWGGEAGFWWGKCPLRGEQESHYSILPHQGAWFEAGLWRENEALQESIVTQEMDKVPASDEQTASLLRMDSPRVSLTSVVVLRDELQARLFCAAPEAETCHLEFGMPVRAAQLVELDGRVMEALPLRRTGAGKTAVQVTMPAFSIRTIRVMLARSKPTAKGTA
ncbi:hypothetical protein [Acidipila sp. EB88]|uniref:glycoside hydrolase family 38 N-terminal domain-containing protein n=1 Tax=Acidipila sp. EB88 TaxID=2305226 RepID=UPI000F5F7BB5|nr:hypothetical protein [Acidipila sp. EB88]RRA47504.1 hypothetical protein D1Y84_03525 [Acidipila sp. EB88]